MSIIQVEGKSMQDALLKAREEVGERGVVVTHRVGKRGVTLAVSREVPRSTEALERMRRQAKELFEGWARSQRLGVGTADVERCLRAHGASRRLTERVCEAVAGRLDEGAHPLDLASDELGAVFPVAGARVTRGETAVLAFVGGAGAGKSTTVAKIGARLAATGRRVLLLTLDVERTGALEHLRALGRDIGVPAHPLKSVARLVRLLASEQRPDVVLLDTAGAPVADAEKLRALARAIDERALPAHLQTFLVAPAVSRPATIEETLAELDGLPLAGAVVTKLDETTRPLPVLEFCAAQRLGVAFLTDGRDLATRLHRATPAAFADVCLRGRVSR